MSLSSFLSRSIHDPAYPIRRARWELWRWSPERDVEIHSLHGKLSFSSKDQIIGRALYLTREFAMSDIELGCRLLIEEGLIRPSANPLLLDIGANIGTTCVPLVKTGLFQRAKAFEPEEKNVSYLQRNIARNGLSERIEIHSCALSDHTGTAELALSESNFGDHRVATSSSNPERKTKTIQLNTLDELTALSEVSLIWMDTQGHEAKILRGGRGVFSKRVPMVTEFWPVGIEKSGSSGREFCEDLMRPYRAFYDLSLRTPIKRPILEVPEVFETYLKSGSYTDLVLIP